jgi:ABC-2 type transport system permease protein
MMHASNSAKSSSNQPGVNQPGSNQPGASAASHPLAMFAPPLVQRGGYSPFWELIRGRLLEFVREPELIFWVYGFPLLMTLALGIAYREQPLQKLRVDVADGPLAAADMAALVHVPAHADKPALAEPAGGMAAQVLPLTASLEHLRTGRADLVIDRDPARESTIRYHFDPTRPESVLARDRARDALERAAGRRDLLAVEDVPQTAIGSRYIDFLIPGLMGLSLMGGGLWGVGFVAVEMRIRRLLKRFLATPMRRWQFLLSIMVGRMLLMIPEMLLLVFFSRWAFGVRIFGNPFSVAILVVLGALCFAGIGLLVASRAKTLEAINGMLNLIMLPMWLASGVFFPRERYPEAIQPLLRALPLTALVDALRGVMLEGLPLAGCWTEVVTLVAWAAVSFTVALRIFRWT